MRVALLALLVVAPAFGRLAENLNRQGLTAVYEMREGQVVRLVCSGKPASTLETDKCRAWGNPLDLAELEKQVRDRAIDRIEGLQSQKRIAEGKVDQSAAYQAKLASEITALEAWGSSLVGEYKRRQQEQADIEQRQRQEVTQRQAEIDGLDELFASKILDGEFLHAIDKDGKDYAVLRPWVPLLASVFSAAEGTRFGKNTWWDSENQRVWWTDFRRHSVWALGSACPADKGYVPATPRSLGDGFASELRRFAEAVVHGETGFAAKLLTMAFWTGPAPEHRDAIDRMSDNLGWARSPSRGALSAWYFAVHSPRPRGSRDPRWDLHRTESTQDKMPVLCIATFTSHF